MGQAALVFWPTTRDTFLPFGGPPRVADGAREPEDAANVEHCRWQRRIDLPESD